MKVIGITGGIGSGKSTVTQYLADLGATVIDADIVGHESYMPDTKGWHDVVAEFGQQVVAENGEINRKKLGEIVFNNPEARTRLNAILHPRMFDMMKERIDNYKKQGKKVVVIEAAVMIEAKWTPLVDELWVAVASEGVVIERIKSQRGMSEDEILSRIRSQLSNEERSKHAEKVITNDGSPEELRETVGRLWRQLQG